MIKVEVVQDEHQECIRWLKASHNGVAWSLIEIRSDEEALQIMSALQQSVQADGAFCACVENWSLDVRGNCSNCDLPRRH